MSIRIMTKVWDNGPDDKNELLVLLSLADNANDEGLCWPSISTIAKKCRMSDRGVIGIIERLEKEGLLRIYRSSTDGKKNVNKYYIQTKNLEKDNLVVNPVHDVVNPVHDVVNPVHEGSEPRSHKSSINLNNNNGEIFSTYESEIGMLSPHVSDMIQDAEKDYPQDWIIEAIKIAAKSNKRNWGYVEGILKRWKAEGRNNGKKEYRPEEHATEVYQ